MGPRIELKVRYSRASYGTAAGEWAGCQSARHGFSTRGTHRLETGATRTLVRSKRAPVLALLCALLCRPLGVAAFQPVRTYPDRPGDTLIRKTDFGEQGRVDPRRHRLIDLLDMTIGRWQAPDPQADPFQGQFGRRGDFLRLNLRLAGLVNPPGIIREERRQPFTYGPHPIFGFIEVDMDATVQTGGELKLLDLKERYLANVARFGGKPSVPRFKDRVARRAADIHLPFNRPPFVKRSGEEFHLAFLGHLFREEKIERRVGNRNFIFEAGEMWRIKGPIFHRAHGFEKFSLAEGCEIHGGYLPQVDLEFLHDVRSDVTLISLVYPLTNAAAARMRGEREQRMNGRYCDHSSVEEALFDLILSARWLLGHPSGDPAEPIILGWARQHPPHHYLMPTNWLMTALLGTTYSRPRDREALFVWTDVYPNLVRGDVNGDEQADERDKREIQQYIEDEGHGRGYVEIPDFASDFSIFDINYSDSVDLLDARLRPRFGDGDGDDDVDLADFAVFQRCFSGPDRRYRDPLCAQMDGDRDGDVDLDDLRGFEHLLLGPDLR